MAKVNVLIRLKFITNIDYFHHLILVFIILIDKKFNLHKKFVIIVIMIIINCRIIDQIQFQSIASQFSKIC